MELMAVHGTHAQNLVEKILRLKIYEDAYWKEQCFGLTSESLVDRAIELDAIGGTFGGNRRPTKFICLVLKMLHIQPEKEIIVEFIMNEDYKYVRALGAFYLRLVGKPLDVYNYLEPLYNDYRKIRRRHPDSSYSITHIDEFVDELLTSDYSCDISLPFLPKRHTLEEAGQLMPRVSALQDELEIEDALQSEKRHHKEDKRDFSLRYKGPERRRGGSDSSDRDARTSGHKRERETTDDASLSVEETNKIRESLGLKPLK